MEEQRPQDGRKNNGKNQSKTKPWRRIGPDSDIRNGVHFSPLLEPLRTLYFDGYIPDAKCRLILVMLGNSPEFHVRRSYLEARFSKHTLAKYLPELVKQKVLEVEEGIYATSKKPSGQSGCVYHVNSVRLWQLPELVAWNRDRKSKGLPAVDLLHGAPTDGGAVVHGALSNGGAVVHGALSNGGAVVHGALSNDHNETNPNEINSSNETNPNHPSGGVTPNASENARAGATGAPNHPPSLVQFARDNFDTLFAREGRTRDESLGFDFSAANQVVADLVRELGFERAEAFSRYARAYKIVNRRVQIKPSEIPKLLLRFLSQPDPNSPAPSRAPDTEDEPAEAGDEDVTVYGRLDDLPEDLVHA